MVDDVVSADNYTISETDPVVVQEQTATFKETPSTYSVNIAAPRDSTFQDGYSDNVPLGDFLARPVKIVNDTWTTNFSTSTVAKEYDPWTLWQDDARVKAKLQNFAYGSWDLKIRFVVNGSPFQYGRLLVVYVPYGDPASSSVSTARNQIAKQMQVWGNSGNGSSDGAHEVRLRHFSTYPHAFLNPSSNQVVEMTLPFIWHNNYLTLNGSGSVNKESLGTLLLYDINPLRIANVSAPQKVRYNVYAWAENLKLTMPTEFTPTGAFESTSLCDCVRRTKVKEERPFLLAAEEYEYVPTSDEYNDGPVSSPASALAAAAGKLVKAPMIGPFARATEIGASAAAGIASIFGFSAPAMVQNPGRYLHKNHGRLANTSGEDSCYSLALDPKQEITVDPSTVGVYPEDEMAISSIVTREQWLARADWRGENGQFLTPGAERILFASLVSPNQQIHSTVGGTRCIIDCPAGHLANMFEFWKGSITYRVEVVCSPYHSGRLKLQFDPFVKSGSRIAGDAFTEDVNARYTTIMDLSEDTSTEFTIDYNSRYPWLRCLQDPNGRNQLAPNSKDTAAFNLADVFDDTVHMGIFVVSVVNDLVAPIETDAVADASHAPVEVNIYMKCGDDFQFAQPNEVATSWSVARFKATSDFGDSLVYTPTSDCHDAMPSSMEHNVIGQPVDDHNTLVFFGESVSSIRALIKRYSLVFTGDYNDDDRNQLYEIVTRYVPHMPAQVAKTKSRRNSFLSYMSPCYLIGRGSTRYKFTYYDKGDNGNYACQSYQWFERQGLRNPAQTVGLPVLTATQSGSAILDSTIPHGYQGAAFTDNTQQSTLEVQLPFYSNTRFMLTAHFETVDTDANETLIQNPTMTQTLAGRHVYSGRDAHANVMQQWHSAGDDFSLHFFTGVPGQFTATSAIEDSLLFEPTSSVGPTVIATIDDRTESEFVRIPTFIDIDPDYWNYKVLNYYTFNAVFNELDVKAGAMDDVDWWTSNLAAPDVGITIASIKSQVGLVWNPFIQRMMMYAYPNRTYRDLPHWTYSAVGFNDVIGELIDAGITAAEWEAKFDRESFYPIQNIVNYFRANERWTTKLQDSWRVRFKLARFYNAEVRELYASTDPVLWGSQPLTFYEFEAINKMNSVIGASPTLDETWWTIYVGHPNSTLPISMIKVVAADDWNNALQTNMLKAYPH